MANVKRSDCLAEAISAILVQDQFFASLMLDLTEIVETDVTPNGTQIKTAATDGHTIWINTAFFEKLSIKERIAVFIHEILHIILDHNGRLAHYLSLGVGPDMRPFDRKKFAHAADYVVNAIIAAARNAKGVAKYALPFGSLLSNQVTANDILDEVYCKLPDDEDEKDDNWDDHEEPGCELPGKPTIQAAVAKAAELSKMAGQGTGGYQRLIDTILDPQVSWQEHLRKAMTTITRGKDTYTWSKPNRRKLATPPHLYMPGKAGWKGPEIAVVIDCSGSISNDQVAVFLGELSGIMTEIEPSQVHVFMIDDAVLGDVISIDDMNDLPKVQQAVQQGGGTDMTVVFDEIETRQLPIETVVIFTDGYTPYPEEETIPTVWCMTTDRVAPNGVTVRVKV